MRAVATTPAGLAERPPAERAALLQSLSRGGGNAAVSGWLARGKTKPRPKAKRGGGAPVVVIATVTVMAGDTPTSMMMRALLSAYGAQGMTSDEALHFARLALAQHPAPAKRVEWKSGKQIEVRLNHRSKQYLDRKYVLRAQGAEIELHGTEPEGEVSEGEAPEGGGGFAGTGDPADADSPGAGSPEGSEGGTGEPGDEGVLEGGVTREEGGGKGGRVGATGVEGGRRGGEGKPGDQGVRGALGWFPLIKVSEYLAPLVEVALILADAGAFDSAFSKLMQVATRAVRSQLRAGARSFAKSRAKHLAQRLEHADLPGREVGHVLELAEAQRRLRYYEEMAKRAAGERAKYVKLVEEGGANRATLEHLTRQRDQAARIEREARELQLSEIDTVNSLKRRDVTTGDADLDAEIAAAIDDADSPAVKGRKRSTIDGRGVPTKRGGKLDIDDIPLRPGENARDAVERVRGVIGRSISDTPLAQAWSEARETVLRGRSIESIGKRGMTGKGGVYDQVRDQFWENVRADTGLKTWLGRAGFDLGDAPAPLLRVNREGLPVQQLRISLDHKAEKAIGQNWRKAIDSDNLRLEFHDPNAFREIVQRRHKLRPEGKAD